MLEMGRSIRWSLQWLLVSGMTPTVPSIWPRGQIFIPDALCLGAVVYHRMVKNGRDFWRSSGQTHLLKQGYVDEVAQDHAQVALEDLQGGDSTTSLSELYQCCHLRSTEVLPDV